MIFGKSRLTSFLLIASAVCVILKLLISYLFPYSRLLLWFFILPVIFISLIISLWKSRKSLLDKRFLSRCFLSIAAVVFALLPIDGQLELARFHVSKAAYQSVAQEVQKGINPSETTVSGRYSLKFPQSMVNPIYRYADYYKNRDSIAILFPASESLSIMRYYDYFSDSKARDMLANPQQYGSRMDGLDRIEELDGSHWAYGITWGDEMPPNDPSL